MPVLRGDHLRPDRAPDDPETEVAIGRPPLISALLCHNVENVDARSARHVHIASNVSRGILDFLKAKMCSCKRHSTSSKCVSPPEAKELILRATRYKRNIKCSTRETVNA